MKRWAFIAGGMLMLAIAAVVLVGGLISFMLAPPMYRAVAVMRFAPGNAAIKTNRDLICGQPSFLFSTNILYPVCDACRLSQRWSQQSGLSEHALQYTLQGTYVLLAGRIVLLPPKDENGPVAIYVSSDKRAEAMELVNAVAHSCKTWTIRSAGLPDLNSGVSIVEAARAEESSVRLVFLVNAVKVFLPFAAAGVGLVLLGRRLPPPERLEPREPSKFFKY